MKLIHEQHWKVRHTNIGPVIDDMSGRPEGEAVCMVYAPYPNGAPMTLVQSDAIRDARATAIEALPEVVRALMRLYLAFPEEALTTEEQADSLNGARAALKNVGALP